MNRFLCRCKNLATWQYMPSSSNPDYDYFCELCVPRGCSCNNHHIEDGDNIAEGDVFEHPEEDGSWKWLIENVEWCYIDSQGRELPCIEFWHEPEGFDANEETIEHYKKHNIKYFTTDEE